MHARSPRTLALAALVALTASAAAAQAPPQVPGASGPPPAPPRRAHHALAYDPVRQRVLLAGGSTPLDGGRRFQLFDDLWELDGDAWRPLAPSGERLSGVRLAWDPRRRRMLSLGGYDGRSRGDLRMLEGDAWRTLDRLADRPAAEPGFVYDAGRGVFVAFGGSSGPGAFLGDTWEWDGARWVRLDVPGPPPRAGHAMVYDERRGVTVLFGGMAPAAPGARPESLGDTWEFDGARWTPRSTDGPLPRHGAGAAYDARRGLVVLFGGAGGGGFRETRGRGTARAGASSPPTAPSRARWASSPTTRGATAWCSSAGARGGRTATTGDTWTWNGSRWERLVSAAPR